MPENFKYLGKVYLVERGEGFYYFGEEHDFIQGVENAVFFRFQSDAENIARKVKGKVVQVKMVEDVDSQSRIIAYEQVKAWISKKKGTHSAAALVKLVGSLYNGNAWPYSLSTILGSLDRIRSEWAMALVRDYVESGETKELYMLMDAIRSTAEKYIKET